MILSKSQNRLLTEFDLTKDYLVSSPWGDAWSWKRTGERCLMGTTIKALCRYGVLVEGKTATTRLDGRRSIVPTKAGRKLMQGPTVG